VYVRGLALLRLRRWTEAAAALEAVPATSHDLYVHARAAMAQALRRDGRSAEAVRTLQRALETAPRDPALLFALGETYDRSGEREAALAQMRAILAVKPDHAEALNYLGYSYAERGERLDEAERMLRVALRSEPDNAAFLDSMGWVLFKKGELERAIELLERAAALAGSEPTILDHLGDAYRSAQRAADAAAAYRRALDAGSEALSASAGGDGEAAALESSLRRKLDELGPVAAR
jgi:Flp pilus assembly protein TadD